MHRKSVHHHHPRLLIFRNICLCVRVVLVRFHNHCCFVYQLCHSVSAMRTYCRHTCVAAIRSCCLLCCSLVFCFGICCCEFDSHVPSNGMFEFVVPIHSYCYYYSSPGSDRHIEACLKNLQEDFNGHSVGEEAYMYM